MADEKVTRPRNVTYGILAVQDALPEKGAPGPRTSPLTTGVEEVMADHTKNGKAVNIAVYESKTACAAAANVLRQRFGRTASAKGVEFATRKHTIRGEDGEPVDRHGLWVVHDPKRVVQGDWDKHVKAEKDRLQALADAKKNGKSKEAKPAK